MPVIIRPCGYGYCACTSWGSTSQTTKLPRNSISIRTDAQQMTSQLRQRYCAQEALAYVNRRVECDKVYIVAGHKGKPDKGGKKAARPAQTTPRETRTRHAPTEKLLVFGMTSVVEKVVIRMLENVQQRTIKPLIKATLAPGTCIIRMSTTFMAASEQWGYAHASVCHSRGGTCSGMGTVMAFMKCTSAPWKDFWSLLRSWLRPHRGISQDHLPLYLGFFEFVHNVETTRDHVVMSPSCALPSLAPLLGLCFFAPCLPSNFS